MFDKIVDKLLALKASQAPEEINQGAQLKLGGKNQNSSGGKNGGKKKKNCC